MKVSVCSESEYLKSKKLKIEKKKINNPKYDGHNIPNTYKTISLEELEILDSYAQRVFDAHNYNILMNISCIIFRDGRHIFFDIQIPQNKAYALSNKIYNDLKER